MTGMARCCARVARGHVAAIPPESLMKSRRRIVAPPPKKAHRTNRALALKVVRLDLPQKGMSALPPKADMGAAQISVCYGPKADILAAADDWN
jgi:hypothetical protein